MSDVVIRFDQVSKQYRLRRGGSVSIRDELATLARRVVSRQSPPRDEFWALRDVSFAVPRGETLGLIGPNGAGKSTALKILSRVTVPTAGIFTAHGTIGALIEIGAGFHPELTGRENVYLNGAIMGMRRAEIDGKFDRIVAFAEVEAFIDTPIKYYSSGMMARLGFAVAAHVDPDILLVDEVLAVGDASFQAKCLNKLAELKERRKTVILVSHAMSNILQHATRVLWIDHGRVQAWGEPEPIVEAYLQSVQTQARAGTPTLAADQASPILIREVTVRDAHGRVGAALAHGQPATIDVAYEVAGPVTDPVLGITFQDARGASLGGLTSRLDGVTLDTPGGRGALRLVLSPVLFTRGVYTVTVALLDARLQRYLDLRPGAATFTVDGPSVATREVSGHVVYPHRWEGDRGGR